MVPAEPAGDHPLLSRPLVVPVNATKAPTTTTTTGASSAPASFDPLSSAADVVDPLSMGQSDDPLSRAVLAATSTTTASSSSSSGAAAAKAGLDDSFEPWASKRAGVLSKYTTNEKLSITFSGSKGAAVVKAAATDKVKQRLEQLDDLEEGSLQEQLDLSQAEYIRRIEDFNQELKDAWEAEGRVKSLKISIQCAKLLADTSVIRFYPSKFVLVTDLLDTFGFLVYDRILRKSAYLPPGATVPKMLPENFTPDIVPDSAKETCRNWFLKIASIRELIPRFFVEAAILKCYSFLTTGEYEQALLRLTAMIRGIGDPLVAIYARCYLCRVGVMVAPHLRSHVMANFRDFMMTFKQLSSDTVQNMLALQRVEMPVYLNLFTPALDWILQCASYQATDAVLTEILGVFAQSGNSALLLNSIISSFAPEYIAARALQFVELIKQAASTGLSKHHLVRTLGVHVVLTAPPRDMQLPLLNEVWKMVMKLEDPAEYISCAEVWIEFPCKYFGRKEINAFLGDIIKHMQPDRAFEKFLPQLQSILTKILSHVRDFNVLFSIDRFLPFLDLFQVDRIKVDMCKSVLEAFVAHQAEPTSDPVIVNALTYVGKTLHDSITAMTFEDEKRQIARLIVTFLSKVSFGRDFEQTLNTLMDARASFSNLDSVLVYLVHSVNQLTMQTRAVVGGRHSRKTAAFVRSCVAFTFITIPSIAGPLEKLRLYLESAQVAVANQALGQADALVKAAIVLFAEVPPKMEVDGVLQSTENELVDVALNMLGTLLIVPDNPEQGVLTMFRGLLNAAMEYKWASDSDALATIYTRALHLLGAYAQSKYIHKIEQVDTNDLLYGASPAFQQELARIADSIIEQVMGHISKLGDSTTTLRRQSQLALDLFDTVCVCADISKPSIVQLLGKLWAVSKRADAPARVTRSRAVVSSLAQRRVAGAAELLNSLVGH